MKRAAHSILGHNMDRKGQVRTGESEGWYFRRTMLAVVAHGFSLAGSLKLSGYPA